MAFWEKKKKRAMRQTVDRFRSLIDDNKVDEARLTICRLAGKGKGASIRVLKDVFLTDMDSDTMEGYLEENFGDGNYRVKVTKIDKANNNSYLGQVDYFIGEEADHTSNLESRIITDYFDIIKTKLTGSNGDGFDGEIKKALVARMLADPNDAMIKTLEVVDLIAQRQPTPTVSESDPTTNLLMQILAPVVSTIIQNKFGNSLMQASPAPVQLPGTPQPLGALSTPAKNEPDLQKAFETIFLDPISKMTSAPAEDVAEKVYIMIGYCQSQSPDQLHPAVKDLVEGMVSNKPEQLQLGFIKLCEYLKIEQSRGMEIALVLNEMEKLSRQKYEEKPETTNDTTNMEAAA